jgi:hypothetical protein
MALEVRTTLSEYASGVDEARRLAHGAIAWLVLLGLERLYEIGVQGWIEWHAFDDAAFDLLGPIALLAMLAKMGTAALFLWWLATVVRLTNALSAHRLPWGPLASVMSFLVPIVNLIWPCAVLLQVNAALAPSAVPEPPPRAVVDSSTGYRGMRWEAAPAAPRIPRAPIVAWWLAFCIGAMARDLRHWSCSTIDEEFGVDMVATAIDLVAIGWGILVVRAVTARLVERLRRIEHNEEAVVRGAGIVLP